MAFVEAPVFLCVTKRWGAAAALRSWTTRLRQVFIADADDNRCAAINSLLIDGVANVFLTTHDDLRPHLFFSPDENDVVGRVTAVTAGGLALLTVEASGQRFGNVRPTDAARSSRTPAETAAEGSGVRHARMVMPLPGTDKELGLPDSLRYLA